MVLGWCIYIPEKHPELSRMGNVMAVGGDVEGYNVGDRVLVMYYGGVTIHLIKEGMVGDTHRIFNASNILAKIEE